VPISLLGGSRHVEAARTSIGKCDAVWDATVSKNGARQRDHRLVCANDGQIRACGAYAKPRGITDEHLIRGAKIVTAAMVVEAMANGASTLGF
jgi:sulfur relay (sulfurtransferase) complex TusBCD TusD component (DsrE family)